MKKRSIFKRVICLSLVAVMLLATLTGCGKSGSKGNDGRETLVIGLPQKSTVLDHNDVTFTKYVEDALNINLEFVTFSDGNEANNQLTLMCAGGEKLPDVLVGFSNLGKRMMAQFGEDGFFIDLTDLLKDHAPTFNAQMEKLSEEEQARIWNNMKSAVDGKVYGLPTYSAPTISDYMQNMMYINQDWLDAVGKKNPTTVDELYDVLVAFRDEDPNGNGKADEIPMFRSGIWNYVINAFVYYDAEHPLNVTDGKVWSPVVTDEFRQAMIFLNKMYEEELITDQSFSSNSTDMKALISGEDETATVGIWYGQPLADVNSYMQTLDQYEVMNPLADKTGKGGYVVVRPNDLLISGFITKDCKDPELAMKFMDFLYEDESVTRRRHGEKDVHWEYTEEAEESMFGTMSNIRILGTENFGSAVWGVHLPNIYTDENYLTIAEVGTTFEGATARLLSAQTEIMKTWTRPAELASNLAFTAEEDDKLDRIDATLTSFTLESISLFIVGDKDPNKDADWNEYVKMLKEYKLDEKIKVYQAAYDRK